MSPQGSGCTDFSYYPVIAASAESRLVFIKNHRGRQVRDLSQKGLRVQRLRPLKKWP